MPKSKKKKKADFQKVKLKVGKHLPKGGTETNISFKTRTIKVSQIIKDPSKTLNQPQTKGKLTLQELLKQCSANKSCSQRLAAVEGFKELLSSDAGRNVVLFNLHEVMVKVSGLLSDIEPLVRQAVLRLCKTVFYHASSEKDSFFDYMSAQLCCAMNHISDDVRRDSLVLFDMLLEKYPRRAIGEFSGLVPNLIDQISSRMLTGKAGSKVRTLVFNPDSKLSSQQWRAQVLQRLKTIVDIFVDKHKADTARMDEEAEVYQVGIDCPVVRGPTVPPHVKKLWTAWPQTRSLNNEMQEYAYLTRNANCLQKFIASLLPLIKQCWIEEHCSEGTAAAAAHGATGAGQQLRDGSLPMLRSLVGLLHSFVECWRCVYTYNKKECVENCWFRGEFLQELRELLLPHFPIYIAERAQKDKTGPPSSQTALQTSVLKLNLLVCEALAGFPPQKEGWPVAEPAQEDWHKVIVSFLLKNLNLCAGAELSRLVAPVLRRVFFHFPTTKKQGKLLAKAQKRFINAHPLSTEKRVYLELFEDMAFDFDRESPFHVCYNTKHALLESFFQSLPGLLLQLRGMENAEPTACQLMKVMCHSSSKLLTDALEQHMEQLLDVKTGVFVELPESCHQIMVEVMKCAYQKQPAPEKILELVELICRLPQVKKETAHRLVEGLLCKFEELMRRGEFPECRKHYLRFLLTILVGHKRSELEAFHDANSSETGGLTRILWVGSAEEMEKHAYVVEKCKSLFGSFFLWPPHMFGTNAMDFMAETWTQKVLSKYCALSVYTACGALMHWCRLMKTIELVSGNQMLHIDNAPLPPTVPDSEYHVMMWHKHVDEVLPVFKARMRPFTKLAFSVVYSIISFETAEEEVAAPEPAVVKTMWETVIMVMKLSLKMLLDLCQVMSDFVHAQQSEKESMRVILGLTKLLSSEQLFDLKCTYQNHVKKQIEELTAAVLNATPQVESQQWWQDFLRLPL